jgi:hypothetical protein
MSVVFQSGGRSHENHLRSPGASRSGITSPIGKSFFCYTCDQFFLRIINTMQVACLIQDFGWVELKNLIAKRDGVSSITADLADENVSPRIGSADLIIDGEEFAGNVVRHTDSKVIFQSDRFEEIAEKLSSL